MGKKTFVTMIVAVVAVFAGYNIYASQKTRALSELVLANVEALAENEGILVGYDHLEEKRIEIWNEELQVFEQHITYLCVGVGGLDCSK